MEENKVPFEAEENEEEYDPTYVTLTDEDGCETEFELVDTLDYNGQTYVALLDAPNDDPEDYLQSDGNLVILKYVRVEGEEEEMLSTIEDDAEFEEISDIFMGRLSDLFEFDEGDEE